MTRTESRRPPAPPREFRVARALVVLIALCVPLFVAGTAFMYSSEGWANSLRAWLNAAGRPGGSKR